LSVLDQFNSDVIYQNLAEINAVPPSWMRGEKEIQDLRAARAEQQQMQQALEAAPAAAGVMKALQ
jgi:NADH:ubiquinone oxidoreductase subunit